MIPNPISSFSPPLSLLFLLFHLSLLSPLLINSCSLSSFLLPVCSLRIYFYNLVCIYSLNLRSPTVSVSSPLFLFLSLSLFLSASLSPLLYFFHTIFFPTLLPFLVKLESIEGRSENNCLLKQSSWVGNYERILLPVRQSEEGMKE